MVGKHETNLKYKNLQFNFILGLFFMPGIISTETFKCYVYFTAYGLCMFILQRTVDIRSFFESDDWRLVSV